MTRSVLLPGPLARLLCGEDILRADADFAAAAGPGWPARIMGEDLRDRFHTKQGRSISRWTLNDSLVVYLKRHYVLPRAAGLWATLFPAAAWSPGLQEWEHLAWARSVGLPVPRPVAAGEFRGPGGRLQSFLAVEELKDMLPLNEAIPLAAAGLPPAAFARWKRGLVAELARLARGLHKHRRFHKDLYLCHFYLPAADCSGVPGDFAGRVHMIDFHRLGRHRVGAWWYTVKDLAQLLYSTMDTPGLTDRDRLRFWHAYRGGEWGSATVPTWLRKLTVWKGRLYYRHNAKKALAGGAH